MTVLRRLGWPRSLSARLAAAAVVLVALVSAVVTTLDALTLRDQLYSQFDTQVGVALDRSRHGLNPVGGPDDGDGDSSPLAGRKDGRSGHGARPPAAVVGLFPASGAGSGTEYQPDGDKVRLAARVLDRLSGLEVRPDAVDVDLPGLGTYRALAFTGVTPEGTRATLVVGLSTAVPDHLVADAVLREVLVALLATTVAGLLGTYLVRRQLQPLQEVAATAHEVAELPLSSGEVDIPARVPERLTDERTEVGQVGSALNTLLGHVEEALDARHRSEQQVRQFVADASHELRTPLATIQGYAELARRTHAREPEELLRALEKVETEGVRMTSLVEDLLLLARLDAGRPLAHDEVDLTRLVLEAVSDARVVTPDHRWRLQLPDDPVDVPGDELRIRQVLVNLLSNAARHTPPGTTVTVTVADLVEPTGPWARVEVHDDGPGVPESLQPTVFERFTRADSARTREVGGAGLGLSLARAIARAHRGDLTLASRPGSTTFALTLPATAAVAAVPVPAPQSL